jgi:hypothetical protein
MAWILGAADGKYLLYVYVSKSVVLVIANAAI